MCKSDLLLFLSVLNFSLIGCNHFLLFSGLSFFLSSFSLRKHLFLNCLLLFKHFGLTFDFFLTDLSLLILDHFLLLFSEFLLLFDLLYYLHLVLILFSELIKILMQFRLHSAPLHGLKLCFKLLRLLLHLSLYHLNSLGLELQLFSVPISEKSFFLLFDPSLVLKEAVKFVQVHL